MLKLTTDKHEASRGLSATAELLVRTGLKLNCLILVNRNCFGAIMQRSRFTRHI